MAKTKAEDKVSKKGRKYDESAIERFAGLAGIRKKPTPYIGPPDSSGLWTIWREPADNCVDRALAGANDLVHLISDSEPNTYWVVDNGDGIPVGVKTFEDEMGKKQKLSTFFVVTGLTHGGSNFSNEEASRGTHGIGIKATNAMSKDFKVWTFRDGQWYGIEYQSGKLTKDVYKCKAPKLPHGLKAAKGTVVRFEPEKELFVKGSKMQTADVLGWCELTSYLVKGLTVKLTASNGKTKTFKTAGPAEYITNRIQQLKAAQTGASFVFSSKEADIAVAFCDVEGAQVDAYTNGLRNSEGGEHLKALYDALVKSLEPYKGKSQYTPSDLRDGLVGMVNYKIAAPQFNNQPKDKLIDGRVAPVALPQFIKAWEEFWKKNKQLAKDIVSRASELRKKTDSFLKDKKLVKNIKASKGAVLAKLAGVIGKSPIEDRELFIVEGDSAGGSAKRARDKSFQAVYPLRGKPLNAMEAAKDKVNKNKELHGLLAAIGIDITGKVQGSVEYGKIIQLADPDVDGSHINSILMGDIYKYAPSLIKNGNLYVVKAPLYKSRYKGQVYFGMTKDEIYKQAGTSKVDVSYIKGWGELNDTEMGIAMDPAIRKLYRVTWSDKKNCAKFELLLGKKPAFRKQLFGVE